jgi:hypothetical protein
MCERAKAMTTRASNDNAPASDIVEFELSMAEHRALLAFKYLDPWQLEAIRAAAPIGSAGEFVLVKMDGTLAEMLVGDLSYVINCSKLTRRIELLNGAAEAIEQALR